MFLSDIERINEVLREIFQRYPGENYVVTSHGGKDSAKETRVLREQYRRRKGEFSKMQADFIGSMTKLVRINENLASEIVAHQKKISNLFNENTLLKESNKELSSQHVNSGDRRAFLDKWAENIIQEIEKVSDRAMEDDISNVFKRDIEMQRLNAFLDKNKSELAEACALMKKQAVTIIKYEKQFTSHVDTIDSLTQELEQCKHTINVRDAQLFSQLELRIADLTGERDMLQDKCRILSNSTNTNISFSERAIAQLTSELVAAEQNIQILNQQIADLRPLEASDSPTSCGMDYDNEEIARLREVIDGHLREIIKRDIKFAELNLKPSQNEQL